MTPSLNAIVPMACVTAAGIAAMVAESFRDPGERMGHHERGRILRPSGVHHHLSKLQCGKTNLGGIARAGSASGESDAQDPCSFSLTLARSGS